MSVRATSALVGDAVKVTDLPNSPKMIVTDFDADARTVTTIWFTDSHGADTGEFPATALDRVEAPPHPASKNAKGGKK